jgi:hypothetical protein
VTLRAVFNSYGVAQENIGFILDASYCLLVTGMLLLWYICSNYLSYIHTYISSITKANKDFF